MPIPDYQTLMLPVLLSTPETEIRVGDVIDHLAEQFSLTQEERAQLLPSGAQTLFANRVHWAKTYLGKAGLIESTRRGYFKLTPAGKKVITNKPERIDNAFLSQFEAFERFRQRSEPKATQDEGVAQPPLSHQIQTPDEVMRGAHRQIDASLAQELLERIRRASPEFFERLIVSLLLSMDFGGTVSDAGRALGRTGDDGVDGVVDQDALGLDRVYIQAKRYALGNNVGSGAIRDFFGSLDRHKATKGLFVTTSTFSPSAIETAQYLSKRIVLIDGDQLAKLMIRYNVGCRVEETLEIKKIDEDFFE